MEEVESTLVRVMTAAEREWWRRERRVQRSKQEAGRKALKLICAPVSLLLDRSNSDLFCPLRT